MAEQMADGHPPEDCTILVVADSLRDNGGVRVALEYARQWRRMGSPAQVVAVQDVDDVALAPVDPIVPVGFLTARNSRFRNTWPAALGRLVRRARRADVVLAGSETGIGLLLGYAAARLARRPFAVLVQADLDDSIATWVKRPVQPLTRYVHAHVDAAISVADSIVPGVVANGLPADRVSVVVNGIDVARVREAAALPPVGTPADPRPPGTPPVVVGQGRLSVQKDFPLLVRAHARVLAAGVDHRLVIIGDGPIRDDIAAVVAEEGVEATVRLAGYVDNPYPITSTADLFVLSSNSEGMPLTILEALAVGVPIVATRCGTGVDLLLADGRYGDLVAVGALDDLSAAIERHLREPSVLGERARGGPEQAMSFDVTRSARTIHDLLAGLDRPGPARRRTPAPVS
ncbi:glycosyltransferase [Pseudonocardia abyssalis]|uniref:Glycosyltransferase n=1 Tax=Pseudonocardia abyssalis TaxID=2792008 RepID=A0ABS6UUQ3_9PSEU|nr:glycosyltransferase [Pseudonocardia abyssalis]MBW0118398.1 glycosyltransferase [Pseudonocardia abyssalis]MBW0135701.1 glycosyltransferase [Pseudonocardia abyssalis]